MKKLSLNGMQGIQGGGDHSSSTPKDYATGIACGLMVSSLFLGPLGALTLGLSTAPTCLGLSVSYFF